MSPVPLFGPSLHMHQQSQQLHHLEPAFLQNPTIYYVFCNFYQSRASRNYEALPLYTREVREHRKKEHWISSKTIAAITLAAAVQLVSGQCDYTGCSRIPSPVFSHYPDYFNAYVIFVVVAFASSGTGTRLAHDFPLLGKFMGEIAVLCVCLAFGLAIWVILPLGLRWISWVSLLPLLPSILPMHPSVFSRQMMQKFRSLLHYFKNWVQKIMFGEA
ncbi:hypothetical protein AMTR_s00067p00024790 [Amborella trichopoda]|uniref:Uncharacterized protein n=1 Tax=Amborella trichopoda TaxID=13333 RepID=U5D8E4_AMBTC|nr:hypothetical protein AMTR_s00067p00024790 [Amborella trichopoda]